MPVNKNTMLRICIIDRCLQRKFRTWTLDDLREACEDALYEYEGIAEVSRRSVQRDLQLMRSGKLGYEAPIGLRDHKYFYYTDPEFSIHNLPIDDSKDFRLMMEVMDNYKNFFVEDYGSEAVERIRQKVLSENKASIHIDISPDLKGARFLEPLYRAITDEHPLAIAYRPFHGNLGIFHLSPYVLKEYNNRWFVIGYSHDVDQVRTLAVDRIVKIEADTENEYVENTFFNPDEYFSEIVGVTRNIDSEKHTIIVRLKGSNIMYTLTKPIHGSQRVVAENSDGTVDIELRLIPNLEFYRLMLQLSDYAQVISPEPVKEEIRKMVKNAADAYL